MMPPGTGGAGIMEIVCITGPVPGVVSATVCHRGDVRSVRLEVARHPSGGWHARLLAAPVWGLRCHTVPTAILLEAAELFADEAVLENAGALAPAPGLPPANLHGGLSAHHRVTAEAAV